MRRIILVMFFIVSFFGYSQEEKTPSYFSSENISISNKEAIGFVDNDYYKSNSQESTINTVYLKQIGDNNNINIDANSGSSQRVTQLGDNNFYFFKDLPTDPKVSFNVNQTGKENSLEIFGTNTFMDGITLHQYNVPGRNLGGQSMKIYNTKF